MMIPLRVVLVLRLLGTSAISLLYHRHHQLSNTPRGTIRISKQRQHGITDFLVSTSRIDRDKYRCTPLSSSTTGTEATTTKTDVGETAAPPLPFLVKADKRPFLQRVERPRPARRMNHPFKYLYRHGFNNETHFSTDPAMYLRQQGGYSRQQIEAMDRSFPVLLQLSTERQLHPKMEFLKRTLGVNNPAAVADRIPAQFFGARLERILAPRHAFLVWAGLPSGHTLLESSSSRKGSSSTTLLDEFLRCRNSKRFAALCQSWRARGLGSNDTTIEERITSKHIEAFDVIFSRGLMAAVRDELVQFNNTWPIEQLPTLKASHVVRFLIQHGANPIARDHRGATLLHWACGSGHWEAARELLPHLSVWTEATRDGATPLHWAAAGTTAREFGVGGHLEVCRNLIAQLKHDIEGQTSVRDYVNCLTFDGNSALMWAAWSGTLETVKLLVRSMADTKVANRNGCTVAHWAASGGNLDVCKYLAEVVNVDFSVPNHGGNTPLSHAVAFGRTEVVNWLLDELSATNSQEDEMLAYSLAQDFVAWTDGVDNQRKYFSSSKMIGTRVTRRK